MIERTFYKAPRNFTLYAVYKMMKETMNMFQIDFIIKY